uniref:Uncharacterized protein n=1 Tax=Sparus aurata TaxID=8175 RepID=A0A671VZ65_SPAAU
RIKRQTAALLLHRLWLLGDQKTTRAKTSGRVSSNTNKRKVADSTDDWIGKANTLSNPLPILESLLRRLSLETEDWNHDFLTEQNIAFMPILIQSVH